MSPICFNAVAAERRARNIESLALAAEAHNQAQFSERMIFAGYVLAFFVVTFACVFAVVSAP